MSRPYRLMYDLLYPAVLGTVLLNVFLFLSQLVEGKSISGFDFGIGKLVLMLGVVIHFIVDYILAQEAPEHRWLGFGIDCGVLAGLWVAAASVHVKLLTAPDIWILCVALACVYFFFLFYLWIIRHKLQHAALVAVVEILSLLWFIVGAVWFTNLPFAAIGLFGSAILLFLVGNKALRETAAVQRKQEA